MKKNQTGKFFFVDSFLVKQKSKTNANLGHNPNMYSVCLSVPRYRTEIDLIRLI